MRIQELDFLRGIAVLLVVFFHFPLIPYLEKTGYAGVDLFFVLSGFLISGLLFKEQEKFGDVQPVRFLIRRGFKIYPLYYFFIALTLIVFFIRQQDFSLIHLIGEITFTRNFLGGFWVHTWSLCVEEHFYLIIALLMFYFKRDKWQNQKMVNSAFIFIFCFSIIIELFNAYLQTRFGENYFLNEWARRVQTQYCFDSLLYGVFVCYHYRYNRDKLVGFLKKYRLILFTLSVTAALLLPLYKSPFFNPFKDTLLYISYGNILLLLITQTINLHSLNFIPIWKWFIQFICHVGIYSYSIYLFHVFVRDLIILKYDTLFNHPYSFAIYFVISIFIAVIFSKLIEVPMLKIREKWFPARS